MDEKRIALDVLRSGFQQVQRNQFEAEKKVVVADTSIQNLSRAINQIEDDKVKRDQQRTHFADELHLRERELNIKRTTSINYKSTRIIQKSRYCKHRHCLIP